MEKTHIKRENFIAVQGWMILDFGLKGNELLIYACIYGFTQTENQWFTGSRQYLADWTNSTKQGVDKCLKSLLKKKLIEKRERYENGVKCCEYRATEFTSQQSLLANKVYTPSQQSLPPHPTKFTTPSQQSLPPHPTKFTTPSQQSLHNNINNTIVDTTINKLEDNLVDTKTKDANAGYYDKDNNIRYIDVFKDIVDYLNAKCGTNYKHTTKTTQKHIHARLKEDYTLADFYTVIDKKSKEWLGTEWEKYLAPETLFGTKFEKYLNQKNVTAKPKNEIDEWRNLL